MEKEKKDKKTDYTIIFLVVFILCILLLDGYLLREYLTYKKNISILDGNYSAVATGVSKLKVLRDTLGESTNSEKASKLLTFFEQVAKRQDITYQASPIEKKRGREKKIIEVGYRLMFKEIGLQAFTKFVSEVQKTLPYIKAKELVFKQVDEEGLIKSASISLVYFKRTSDQ